MVKPDLERACAALAPSGFARVQALNEVAVVRPSDRADLFERIELMLVGRKRDALRAAAVVSVIKHPDLTLEGLWRGASLDELSPQASAVPVSFASAGEQEAWMARLAELAPKKVRELAKACREPLLGETALARKQATRAFDGFIRPALRADSYPEELEARLYAEEQAAVEALMELPLMRVLPLWEEHCRAAASALVLSKDPDVLSLAMLSLAKQGPGAAVPPAAAWKLRLLVDQILRALAR